MRQFRAILADSMRESFDRRALVVMLGLCLIPIIFCFGISFEADPLETVLTEQARTLTRSRHLRRVEVEHEVRGVTPVSAAAAVAGEADTWSAAVQGGLVVELAFPSAADLDRLAVAWFERRRELDEVPETVDGEPRSQSFLRERFVQFGYDAVEVQTDGKGGARVAAHVSEPAMVQNAHRVSLFGAIEFAPQMSVAAFVLLVQKILSNVVVGFVGILIGLFACSGFVPNMLQKGTLDLALARPISRTKLLLAKYVGGLWFVFCIASFAVIGSWLGLVVGSGYSNPAFLVSIVTLTFTFAVLYSVAVCVGLKLRSAGMSALLALGVWFLSSSAASGRAALARFEGAPDWVHTVIDVLYWVLPKIKDIDHINTVVMAGDRLNPELRAALFDNEIVAEVDWGRSLGTSAAFAAAMLGLAVWQFRRRDY